MWQMAGNRMLTEAPNFHSNMQLHQEFPILQDVSELKFENNIMIIVRQTLLIIHRVNTYFVALEEKDILFTIGDVVLNDNPAEFFLKQTLPKFTFFLTFHNV